MANDRILLAHGAGGRLSDRLIRTLFLPAFGDPARHDHHDGARLDASFVLSTDAYVVRPLFFPGGSIGHLAVHGTANDLAMCGARPLWLSAAFILEEGLPFATLERVVHDMAEAARASGVAIVTGDTKVVERGAADSLFITTAGVGRVESPAPVAPSQIEPGDAILVSGDLGTHGIAVLSVRDGLSFETAIASDTAPLWPAVEALLAASLPLHCLRDLTRGGLTSALNELSLARGVAFEIDETAVPVSAPVRGACEFLGLDPMDVANEGRFCVVLPAETASKALEILRRFHPDAALIGTVLDAAPPQVIVRTTLGGRRVLDFRSGELLPRIC